MVWIFYENYEKFIYFSGSFRCISNNCPEGYRTEHGKCIDIDECHLGIHTCPGKKNDFGSRDQGFELHQ